MRHMTRFDAFQPNVPTNLGLKRVKTRHMTHIEPRFDIFQFDEFSDLQRIDLS